MGLATTEEEDTVVLEEETAALLDEVPEEETAALEEDVATLLEDAVEDELNEPHAPNSILKKLIVAVVPGVLWYWKPTPVLAVAAATAPATVRSTVTVDALLAAAMAKS